MIIATGALGTKKPSVVYAGKGMNSTSPVNSNSISVNLGTVAASRQVFVVVAAINANGVSDTNYTTGVTVNGASATRIYAANYAGGSGATVQHYTMWRISAPTGTSVNVVATRSTGNGYSSVAIYVFSAYDLRSTTPTSIVHTPQTSITINVVGSGILFAAGLSGSSPVTWTGATKVADSLNSGVNASVGTSAALISGTTAQTARPVSVNVTTDVFAVAAR
jgi:hypothetical protein